MTHAPLLSPRATLHETPRHVTPITLASPARAATAIPLAASGVIEPITRAQVEATAALLSFWPLAAPEHSPAAAIVDLLESLSSSSHARVDLHTLRWREATAAPWLALSPETHALLGLSLPPELDSGLIALDRALASAIIAGMLNALDPDPALALADPPLLGELSARDHGLILYAALRCRQLLCRDFGMPPLQITSLPPSREEQEALARSREPLIELVFLVTTQDRAGLVRAWLPLAITQHVQHFSAQHTRSPALPRGALASASLRLSLTFAWLQIDRLDLWELTAGDVILPQRHALTNAGLDLLSSQLPCAFANLGFQGNDRGALDVTLSPSTLTSTWQCQIASLTWRPHPSPHEPTMNNPHPPDIAASAAEATSSLMREAAVEVELRITVGVMSVADLASLQVGAILDLGVPLNRPVELVAGGVTLATVTLVQIEGQLGARVLTRS